MLGFTPLSSWPNYSSSQGRQALRTYFHVSPFSFLLLIVLKRHFRKVQRIVRCVKVRCGVSLPSTPVWPWAAHSECQEFSLLMPAISWLTADLFLLKMQFKAVNCPLSWDALRTSQLSHHCFVRLLSLQRDLMEGSWFFSFHHPSWRRRRQ